MADYADMWIDAIKKMGDRDIDTVQPVKYIITKDYLDKIISVAHDRGYYSEGTEDYIKSGESLKALLNNLLPYTSPVLSFPLTDLEFGHLALRLNECRCDTCKEISRKLCDMRSNARINSECVLNALIEKVNENLESADLPCHDGWHTGDHPVEVIRISYLNHEIESLIS